MSNLADRNLQHQASASELDARTGWKAILCDLDCGFRAAHAHCNPSKAAGVAEVMNYNHPVSL
jgi:hypothetical protein